MFCGYCGKSVPEGAMLCPYCGKQVLEQPNAAPGPPPAAQVAGQSQYAVPAGYAAPLPKKKKKWLLPVLILAGVAVMAGIAVAAFALFGGGAKAEIGRAAAKTRNTLSAEQAAVAEAIGYDAVVENFLTGASMMEGSAEIQAPELPVSLSASMAAHYDYAARRMDAEMGIGLGGSSLIDWEIGVDGDLIALEAPGIVSGSYGVSGETFGRDVQALATVFGTVIDENLSFTLFPEGMDTQDSAPFFSPDGLVKLKDATQLLWDAVEAEKQGSTDTAVNGVTQSSQVYGLSIPTDALKTWRDAVADVLLDDLTVEADSPQAIVMKEICNMIGRVANALEEDMGFTVYVCDGMLVKAEGLARTEQGEMELALELGDGDALSNAATLEVSENGGSVLYYQHKGDVVMESGQYTNDITLEVYPGGSDDIQLQASIEYAPDKAGDNFYFELRMPSQSTSMECAGALEIDGKAKTLNADLYDTSVTVMGRQMATMQLQWQMGPADGYTFAALDPVMIADMSEDELDDLFFEISENISEIVAAATEGIWDAAV